MHAEHHCPLCGGDNECAIAVNSGQHGDTRSSQPAKCWCQDVAVPVGALPLQLAGQSRCVCRQCLQAPASEKTR